MITQEMIKKRGEEIRPIDDHELVVYHIALLQLRIDRLERLESQAGIRESDEEAFDVDMVKIYGISFQQIRGFGLGDMKKIWLASRNSK